MSTTQFEEATRSDALPPSTTSPPHHPATPRRWYHLGVADLVFLGAALLIVQGARQSMLDDPGLGWHLRNIDAMRAEGTWLTVDSFTQPLGAAPRPWRTNQWLGEVPLWLGERWAGMEGIAAVATILLAFMLRCLYRMFLADGVPWPVAVVWTALAAMGTSCSWVARPNLFTVLFVLWTARVCVLFHEGRVSRRATLWLLPLFAVWANTHGGFVAGFTLLGATLLIEAALALGATSSEGRQQARGRARHLLLLLAGTFACTLLNPYGLSLYRWVFQLLGDPYFMDLHREWRSPDFHAPGAMRFELLMLLLPLLLAVSKRRPTLVEVGLTLLWFHFALSGFRYVALWVVIAAPLLARLSVEVPWLRRQANHLGLEGQGLFANPVGPAPWMGTTLVVLALLGWARLDEGRFAGHKPEIIASAALDRFLEIEREWARTHGRRPVVFHSYDWGGYLTWRGWPEFRNWIDDRNEVQGKEHIQEHFALRDAEPGWDTKLEQLGVSLVCIESGAALTYRLAERPGRWRELYRDHYAVIFERVGSAD